MLLASGLKSKGYVVEFFVYHRGDYFKNTLDELGIEVYSFLKRSRFSLSPILDLRRLIRQGGHNNVIAYLSTPSIYASLAVVGVDNVNLIVSERSADCSSKFDIFRLLRVSLYQFAKYIVVNSQAHAGWMKRKFPWLRRKIVTIRNGVDINLFKPDIRQNPDKSALKIVGIGRISRVKNIHRLIQAIQNIKSKNMDISIDWYGRVDDINYMSELEGLVAHYNLEDRWSWAGENRDISGVLPLYDALVLSSLWEGFPNVVCEAMACAVPIIASDISDMGFLTAEPQRGLLFDPNSVGSIVGAIEKFVGLDRETRLDMGIKGRHFVENELSLERMLDKYEDLLLSLG